MKKLILSILIIFLCLTSFTLISCGGEDDTTTAEPPITYSITYELNGGTNSAKNPDTYKTGEIITLGYPEKADYMFMGWFTDAALTTEIKEIKDKEENLTLYAKWKPLEEVFELFLINGEYRLDRFKNNAKTVIIPSTYKGLPVRKIYTSAFFECDMMEEIYLSSSITSIFKRGPFSGCSSLKRIFVDEGNLNFKSVDGVLYSKDGKALICYPAAKTEKVFDVPQGVEIVHEYAFWNNPYITSINIPDGVKEVYDISRCTALESITLPNSVTKFGGFHSCIALKNVTLSNNIEIIPYQAFYKCTSLESITIPSKVKSIGEFAFYECVSIDEIVIPDTVTEIYSGAFSNCSSELTIYSEAASKPEGWEDSWRDNTVTVVWGHKESNR